jgi:hypothetical protein
VLGMGVKEVELVVIDVPLLEEMSEGMVSFDLRATYDDVAGKSWMTSATYLSLAGRYARLAVRTWEVPQGKVATVTTAP